MNKFEEYLSMAKISDFIHRKELEDEKKKTVCLVIFLMILMMILTMILMMTLSTRKTIL